MLNSTRLTTAFAAAFLLAGCFSPGRTAAAGPLVAHWAFEEGRPDAPATGPILDSSGNGHDGVAVNGPVYRETPGGPSGLALDFNGTDQHLFIPDDPAFGFTDEFTVAVWVNARSLPTAEGARAPIVARGDARPGMNALSLALEDSNIVFRVEDAAGNRAEISRPFRAVGNWVQYVRTYRTRAGQSFLHFRASDSVETDVQPIETLDPAMQPGVYIGGIDGAFFDGLIDEVRVYNRALFRNNNGGLSLLGDTNDDGRVNIEDLNNIRNTFGGDCFGDANFDGHCSIEDLNAIRNEFGSRLEHAAVVPEPSGFLSQLVVWYFLAAVWLFHPSQRIKRC